MKHQKILSMMEARISCRSPGKKYKKGPKKLCISLLIMTRSYIELF
nr:unnamed protein product [Callosobruchus analis]